MLRISELAALCEGDWLAQCEPSSIAGADAARASAKGNRARELINSCIPDSAGIREWANDYKVEK